MEEAKAIGSFKAFLLAVALLWFISFTVVSGNGDGVYNLNLRVMDWDLSDAVSNAHVFMNNGTDHVKVSDENGWANYTGVSGAITVKVQYYGFWVNGTFSITVSGDTTIDVKCNLYDVTVKVVETQQSAYLLGANVTVFNSTSNQANRMATGITGNGGIVRFSNLPNNTLTFTQYAGSSYAIIIGNETKQVSSEDLNLTLTANQNSIKVNTEYSLMVVHNS
ncbi:MAG: hypothetical protein QXM52_04115 [Candidatus Bathyarchaeia archaeon]